MRYYENSDREKISRIQEKSSDKTIGIYFKTVKIGKLAKRERFMNKQGESLFFTRRVYIIVTANTFIQEIQAWTMNIR